MSRQQFEGRNTAFYEPKPVESDFDRRLGARFAEYMEIEKKHPGDLDEGQVTAYLAVLADFLRKGVYCDRLGRMVRVTGFKVVAGRTRASEILVRYAPVKLVGMQVDSDHPEDEPVGLFAARYLFMYIDAAS